MRRYRLNPRFAQMSGSLTQSEIQREALWTFPREWRTMYFACFVVLCLGFGVLAAIEFRTIDRWIEAPFTSTTAIVIGTGTSSGLLSLFITEVWRIVVTFSTWLAYKVNQSIERDRERRRLEREREHERLQRERELHQRERELHQRQREQQLADAISKGRAEGHEVGREEGFNEGRKAGLLEAQGKRPPPPPWER